MRTVALIVEGHGEVKALPILLRRIAGELHDVHDVQFTPPYRASRSTVIKPGELERLVRLVRRECGPSGGILVVLDADDDCPATFGPELLARVQAVDTGPLGAACHQVGRTARRQTSRPSALAWTLAQLWRHVRSRS